MTQYEVLIVGAGPAGSFAAELLAKSGVKVALFDGRPEGEPKACGGGVTANLIASTAAVPTLNSLRYAIALPGDPHGNRS